MDIAWRSTTDTIAGYPQPRTLIRPDGFVVNLARVREDPTGISTKRAEAEGRPVADAPTELWHATSQAQVVVAHNADFDGAVIAAEFLRLGWSSCRLRRREMICTMKRSTGTTVACPDSTVDKWPTLAELFLDPLWHAVQRGTRRVRRRCCVRLLLS